MKNDYLIDKFVLNKLSEEEIEEVKQLCSKDKSFKQDLEFRVNLSKAIQKSETDKLRVRLKKTEKKMKRKENIKKILISTSAAAAIAIMFFTYSKLVEPDISYDLVEITEQGYIEKYYETPPLLLGQTLKGNAEIKNEELAFTKFRNREFHNANHLFEKLMIGEPDNEGIRFYTGITYLETHQYDKALEIFKTLNYDGSLVENTTNWYIALICLEQDNIVTAKVYLEKVNKSVNEFNGKAEVILDSLEDI